MDTRDLLLKFSSVDGNSGDEKLAAKEAVELLSAYGKTYIDNLGSVICEVAPEKNGRHVMLDAHLDQIALLVINIEENGFLRTYPCGGIDRRGIHGTKVRVLGKDGEYSGIVCSIPPHIKDVNDKNPERDEIFIDMGFNKEETSKRVRMGDRVMLCGKWSDIGNGYVTGPALDDRSGCVTILEALELLKDKGYEIKQGKYLAVKPPGMGRFRRCKTLGNDYSEERIRERIPVENAIFPEAIGDFKPKIVKSYVKRYRRAKLSGIQKKYYAKL